jgi:hypothetical protein
MLYRSNKAFHFLFSPGRRQTLMIRLKAFLVAPLVVCFAAICRPQSDPLAAAAKAVHEGTRGQLSVHLEERTRWEERYGNGFGIAKDQQDMLSRIRIGMDYQPRKWFTISGMGQDARAPWYGPNAPPSMRESMDLQEAFVVLGDAAHPVNFSFGRRMINYGETRVIGVPQWTNTARTYDHGRIEYANKRFTLDALIVSPVIVRSDAFNNPEFGNRYWGAYAIVPKLWRGASIDLYALRHSENRIGGWTAAGTLGTNNYGARFYGPLPARFAYSLEAIAQNGHYGLQNQRAYAWFAGVSRPVNIGKVSIDTSAEYKVASGSHFGATHSSTFDQLSPANHDKFGHEDLFGWKNLRTFKALETVHPLKPLAFNIMYTNETLFSASDALYSSSGARIAVSSRGTAGRGVGQELDAFATYTWGPHTFIAGFGHFFRGEFIVNTTPGINPRYLYIAQQYTIK